MTNFSETRHLLRILSGETTLKILDHLRKRKAQSVSEIANAVSRSIPTASIALTRLQSLGIIKRERKMNEVFYELENRLDSITKQVLKEL